MDLTTALDIAREALLTALLTAAPMLGVGIVVGLLISLFQTVTQLNDQTLSIAPKIVAMLTAVIFFIPWLAARVIEYAQSMLSGT
ncbi:MAG: flagellar biosynthetic protein FliQ [Planctomycetes bacterium]|nr:flagellar biosynthetic protein FliQ [Planctomycetota bacterium]